MIRIICPSNNIPERRYAIEVMFNDLLGCNLTADDIQFDAQAVNYTIQVGGKEIVVEDHFFQQYPEPLSYLKAEHLPAELVYFHARGKEIPIIYGLDRYEETENRVTIGLDIFASTFFMLTRWEESFYGRDEKGDCSEDLLFTIKQGIYQRPIVHEYESFLKGLLQELGVQTGNRVYSVILSHDVDDLVPPSWTQLVRNLYRRIRYRKKAICIKSNIRHTWIQRVSYKLAYPTAYSQVKLFVELCEKYNVWELFYFKVCERGEKEATYRYSDLRVHEVVSILKKKGNPKIILGFHPSQSTFANANQWNEECQRITTLLGAKPMEGRNHHLLYNLEMMRLWECTLSTAEHPCHISNSVFHQHQGFRSGVSVPYPIFDYYNRRKMNLIEHPGSVMDTVITSDTIKQLPDSEIFRSISDVIDEVSKYKGELMLTWHILNRGARYQRWKCEWCDKVLAYATNA